MMPETAVLTLQREDGSHVEYVIRGAVTFTDEILEGRIILDFNPELVSYITVHPPQKEPAS